MKEDKTEKASNKFQRARGSREQGIGGAYKYELSGYGRGTIESW
jgi:hypothetical protein